MTPRRLLLPFVIAIGLCGCQSDRDSRRADTDLASVVLHQAPEGFRDSDLKVNGELDDRAAEVASPAPPAAVRRFIDLDAYGGAFSRVWQRGQFYLQDLAYAFDDEQTADQFLDMQITVLKQGATAPYRVGEIPGAAGFLLSGSTRGGTRGVFCNSIWFKVGQRVFLVQNCGSVPVASELANQVAEQQYQLAVAD